MINFGRNLKKVRLKNKFTQEELALKLGTSKQVISNYEKGNREPSLGMLAEISKVFNCSIDSLLFSDTNIDLDILENLDRVNIDLKKYDKESILKKIESNITFLESRKDDIDFTISDLKNIYELLSK